MIEHFCSGSCLSHKMFSGQTMCDQTWDKVNPHNTFCILLLKKNDDVTQIPSLIGHFSRSRKPCWQRWLNDQTFVHKGKCCVKKFDLDQTCKPFKYKVKRDGLTVKQVLPTQCWTILFDYFAGV